MSEQKEKIQKLKAELKEAQELAESEAKRAEKLESEQRALQAQVLLPLPSSVAAARARLSLDSPSIGLFDVVQHESNALLSSKGASTDLQNELDRTKTDLQQKEKALEAANAELEKQKEELEVCDTFSAEQCGLVRF